MTVHDDSTPTAQTPPPPWPPASGWQPPPPPPRKSWPRRHKILTGLLTVVGLAVVGGITDGIAGGNAPARAPAVTSTPRDASPSVMPESPIPTTEPSEAAATPVKADFEVAIKVKSKQCFGSAGCNITWEPRLTYTGPDIPDSDSYDITFVVRGGDDGDQIETINTTGRHYTPEEYMTSTRSSAVQLTATVTEVSPA